MPGSLLNLRDVHSDQSDISAKSTDSKTSGKKVSFNKAVRVKQYPWRPDEYRDGSGSVSLPSDRFWFKVYRSNPSPETNSWTNLNNETTLMDEYIEDAHDSLTPIAEDDDQSPESDFQRLPASAESNQQRSFVPNARFLSSRPAEPPIDYIEDENALFGKYTAYNGNETTSESVRLRNRTHDTNLTTFLNNGEIKYDQRRSMSANGHASPNRSHDFTRPTISSAAKCCADKPMSRQTQNNIRLPRMNVREFVASKNKEDIPKSLPKTKPRERRSRSNDYHVPEERSARSPNRADKAVSTDDLSFDSKQLDEAAKGNRLWWSQQKNKDKSTQCSGTLTRSTKNNLQSSDGLRAAKPPLPSSSTRRVSPGASLGISGERSSEKPPRLPPTDSDSSEHRNGSPDVSSLLVRGRSCITASKRYGRPVGAENGASETFNSGTHSDKGHAGTSAAGNVEKPEYDYVTDSFVSLHNGGSSRRLQNSPSRLLSQNSEVTSHKYDHSTGRLSADHRYFRDAGNLQRDEVPGKATDIHNTTTFSFQNGKEYSLNNSSHRIPLASPAKVKASSDQHRSLNYMSDSETTRNKHAFLKTSVSSSTSGAWNGVF